MKSLLLASVLLIAAPVMAAPVDAAPAATVETPFLLQPWTGPHGGVPPWDKVKPDMFPPAFTVAADKLRAEVRAIVENKAPPTFDNVIGAMEASGQELSRVQSLFGVMTSNMNSPEYQALSREWRPKLAALDDEISLNPKLFARIDAL